VAEFKSSTIFGFIAAISVASVYGKKAVEMQNAMKEAQKNIDTDQKKLKAARTVNADTQRMTVSQPESHILFPLVED
jgi:hypothetical protein